MGLFRKIIYSFFLFLLISIWGLSSAFAVTGEHPVLIISSYNPDARQTSGNIYDFMEEFERLGGKAADWPRIRSCEGPDLIYRK